MYFRGALIQVFFNLFVEQELAHWGRGPCQYLGSRSPFSKYLQDEINRAHGWKKLPRFVPRCRGLPRTITN